LTKEVKALSDLSAPFPYPTIPLSPLSAEEKPVFFSS
jgi:hypothetical protein